MNISMMEFQKELDIRSSKITNCNTNFSRLKKDEKHQNRVFSKLSK